MEWKDRVLSPLPTAPDSARYYDIIDKNGQVVNGEVKLVLKNDILQAGTPVNAENLNKLSSYSETVAILAAGWSGAAPYTQTITVAWLKEAYNIIYSLHISDNVGTANTENIAFGYISKADYIDGTITFTALAAKPNVDLNITIARF